MKGPLKKFLSLSLFVTILVSATACSGNSDSTESGGGQGGTAGATQITLWEQYGPDRGMDEITEEFNQQHEGQIEVTDVYIPGQAELMQKLQVAATTSSGLPDIVCVDMTYAPLINELVPLVDFNNYLSSDGIPAEDFYEELLKYGNIDGKQISLPAYVNNLILYYNKALFEAAGLDPEQPPKTWDEMVSYAQKLTTDDVIGYMAGCFSDPYFEATSWQYQIFVWQNGGETWDENYKPLFNSPEGIEAMQFMKDLIYKYHVSTTAPPENAFPLGKVAMEMNGTWQENQYLSYLEDDLGTAQLPYNKEAATNTGGEQWTIIASEQAREDAAWEYISYMESEEIVARICTSGYVPARKSVAESDTIKELAETHPGVRASIEALPNGRVRPSSPNYSAASEAMAGYLQSAMLDENASVEENLQLASDAFEAAIAGN